MLNQSELEFHLEHARYELKKAEQEFTSARILRDGWKRQVDALEAAIAKLEVRAARV